VPAPGGEALGVGPAQIDAVAIPAVDMLLTTQLPDGGFLDPLRGEVGGSGLTRLVWVALRQASRLSGPAARARVEAASRSLARGTELTQVLPKWVLSLVFDDHLQSYLQEPGPLEREVANLGALNASGTADACFQKPGCFNNYVLAGKLLDLELARTGLHPSEATARLADPLLVARTLRWMARTLPLTTSESAHIHIPGTPERVGAALSDPRTYPLAYQALCTAMLTRATHLAGAAAPPAMQRLEVDALWELLGMTAPNGEISWMGRGQDIVWTLGASFYAAMQGSVLVQSEHPDLAARLRRLAEVDLRALRLRLAPPGLRVRAPEGVGGSAGIDTYYGAIGTASLALVWVELAREASALVGGPVAPLPAEQQGAWTSDPRGTSLLTLRRGGLWLGVSTRRVGRDARTGWGLLRALHLGGDGGWEALLPDRPIAPRYRPEPPAGPLLVAGKRLLEPHTQKAAVGAAGILLTGAWRGRHATPGRWAWAPHGGGVQLTTTCPRRRRLRFTEWLPTVGPLRMGGTGLARGGFAIDFSRPIAVRALAGSYASAREAALTAYAVTVACTGAPLRVVWRGSEPAPA
jgi:hypothetical protein